MSTDSEKSGKTPNVHIVFTDAVMKSDPKTRRKAKPTSTKQSRPTKSTKSPGSRKYHHTPTFAAQSFALTATPEIYKRAETHRLSRPILEHAKGKRATLSIRPPVYNTNDDGSSSDGSSLTPGVTSGSFASMRSPRYEFFSAAILNQTSPTTSNERTPSPTRESFVRRPDWTEMEDSSERSGGTGRILRRMASVASTKASAKSQKTRRFSVGTAEMKGNGVIRVPRDDESIYESRGCIPRRHKAN